VLAFFTAQVKAERDEMKKTLLAKLAAGLFVIGVCGMFTSALAVPTFTFSPLEDGNKTLLTLSGQTDDRSDPRTVPEPPKIYSMVYDEVIRNYMDYFAMDALGVHNYSFTAADLEGLTVTSTLQWDPAPEIPPEHIPPEPPGYPQTSELSRITSLMIGGDIPGDDHAGEFGFVFTNDADHGRQSPFLVTETLSFSGTAILDVDFDLFMAGTYRGAYLGQRLNPIYLRDALTYPTFEIGNISLTCNESST
jgi:hypothetical protein